jgi:hypothetical protein
VQKKVHEACDAGGDEKTGQEKSFNQNRTLSEYILLFQ